MSNWISVKDRLPEISDALFANKCWLATDGNRVHELRYVRNRYAKTEKGRAPRWEDMSGRLAHMEVTHWQPLPEPPK